MPISQGLTFWEWLDLGQKTTAAAEFGLTALRALGHYGAELPWEKRRELWPGQIRRLVGAVYPRGAGSHRQHVFCRAMVGARKE
jgi:hypothetical protein